MPTFNVPMDPALKAELAKTLTQMEQVSEQFYLQARLCGVHSFIEFTGLMNEYIKVCRQSMESGVDFRQANTHNDVPMVAFPFNLDYMSEKLSCIFDPFAVVKMGMRRDKPDPPPAPPRGYSQ